MKRLVLALCAALLATVVSYAAAPAPAQAAGPSWPVLREGSSGSQVRAVQHLLTARGYATTADGGFGPTTKSKVVAFQRSRSLSADGVVGAQTWSALVPTIREGNHGSSVKAAQTLLNRFGYRLTADGAFGPNTKSAVLSFQRAKGIGADGVVGPVTWRYLAGSGASDTNPPATSCGSVTGPVPSSHTTLVYNGSHAFRVHQCLAPAMTQLLQAARAAGHVLHGWSFRSYDQQVALRRQNCGTSYYAIYEMPSSQCNPPTARPGSSMHERGLAIDFNSSGGTLTSAAFNWLVNNASRYGLYNLPSERWHWSTTGR